MNSITKFRGITLLCVFLFILSIGNGYGQVTIGADIEPDMDAILDLKQKQDGTSEKGLLLPRVNLIAPGNPFPLSVAIEGMLVYNKTNDETNNLTPGVYYNDGTVWKRIDILPGGTASQVLSVDDNLQPVWGNLDIPNETSVGYVLEQFAVSDVSTGGRFTNNSTYSITKEGYDLVAPWVKLNLKTPFSVTPAHSKNRLIVTMQAMIQTSANGNTLSAGWIDFAGGVFINNKLNVVKLSQFSHTGRFAFDIFTLYLIVEDLPVGALQNVDLAVARIYGENRGRLAEVIGIGVPVAGVNNLNDFMAKPFISIQYYEDPSSSIN